ncbi:NAD(P)-dependent oxidoreductase [Jatrophihabitans sp. DSM 45814]
MTVIAVVGATGYAGGHIAAEAVRRGHEVLGISRSAPTETRDGISFRAGSVHDKATIEELTQAADVLVIAVPSRGEDGTLVDSIPSILETAGKHGTRIGVVGGAGSLRVSPDGPRFMDTGVLPDFAMPEVTAHAAALDALRASSSDTDWFYLSPAGGFGSYAPGERTGKYRVGDDVMLVDADGNSAISGDDYAIAFVDEIETPNHHRTRFTVAY